MWQRLGVGFLTGSGVLFIAWCAEAETPEAALVYPAAETREAEAVGSTTEGSPARHLFDDQPYYVELRSGWATTVGLIGVVAEYNVSDRLALGAGAGSNLLGANYEVNARVRPLVMASRYGRTLHALTLEASLNTATYSGSALDIAGCVDGCDRRVKAQQVLWGQLELGWEMRLGNGMTMRAGLGGAGLLGTYHWQCTGGNGPCQEKYPPARYIFSQTVAWGIAF